MTIFAARNTVSKADGQRFFSTFLKMTENFYEWGRLRKKEDYYYENVVSAGDVFDIYFNVAGKDTIYTYFELYDLKDDLDLHLYKYDSAIGKYKKISSSTEEGREEELIFKGTSSGDYLLEIKHYEDIGSKNSISPFSVSFDSTSFYDDALIPNDSLFVDQWHLLNTGQGKGADNEDIRAPEAWKIRSKSPDTIVAIIDTGIDINHKDLKNNIWANKGEIAGNGLDDDHNGYVDDRHGWNFASGTNKPYSDLHGTHVAGIVGAEGNNGMGATGVTWETQLMSLDVFNGSKTYRDVDLIDAIYYAADNGADVINMSLGLTVPYATVSDWKSDAPKSYLAHYKALAYAVKKGSTVIIAAGNEDADLDIHLSIPAALSTLIDGVISVAAISNTGRLTDYTNYGSTVTIAAPGGSFETINSRILSTAPGDQYKGLSGTSMASPIVAGGAALLLAENPRFLPKDIESILTRSADKQKGISSLVQDGNYLNLEDALTLAQKYKPSKNKINGSNKSNELKGTKKDDIIFGKKGNDTISGGLGNDYLNGGSGRDTAEFSLRNNSINLKSSKRQNTGDGKDRLVSIENIKAGSGNDLVIGNKAANKLNGQKGNDRLYGGGGKDLLIGGGGKDKLWGQGGRDTFRIEQGTGYTIIKDFSDGVDRIHLGSGRRGLDFKSRGDNLYIYQRKDLLAIVEDVSAGDVQLKGNYLF